MKPISLTITKDGSPIKGVQVVVGEVFKHKFTTDNNGKIGGNVEDTFAVATSIHIKGDDFTMGINNYLIEAGKDYVIEV